MATTSKLEFKEIEVTGAVSVERVDRVQRPCWKVLIMGPTGAGKSSFIEALGLEGSLKISSNGLDGFTQGVSTYKLNNVVNRDGYPIYLVDSPGFADTKISEMAIVSMLQKWMKDNDDMIFDHLLYLTPITSTRLPGTQRQVLKTFNALTGVKTAKNVSIVTTMWDNIGGENASKRAEDNYQQLQNKIWKDFIQAGAQMMQFHNTQESALSILDEAFATGVGELFSIEHHQKIMQGSPFEGNLVTDLQDRIQNLKSHIPTLHDELAHAKAQGDQLLLSTLRPRLQEAEADLARFQKELDDSGLLPPVPLTPLATPPTDSEPCGNVPQATNTTHVQQSENQVFLPPLDPELAVHGQPAVKIEAVPDAPPISEVVTLSIPPSDLQQHIPPSHEMAAPSISRSIEDDVQAEAQQTTPVQHAPGRFARIMQLMKCWGDAVGERHDA
ncbi:P-loop containing nucleoside triphosphate hydrolase protein [Panaeolus papilionaceus]|nr:P-loop containing nucleoside triphosphate hydrolase protein [Panaeolus papilionaceus]